MNILVILLILVLLSLAITFAFLYFKNVRDFDKLQRLRNDFMAMVIHELRSPLSVIRSSADMVLKSSDKLNQQQITDLLTQIEDSSSDLIGIVNQLLDVSKIEAGRIEIFKHSCNLPQLLEEESTMYRNLAKEKGIELHLILEEGVEQINCDPEKIKQVINNLLSNAIKFTHQGYVSLELTKYHDYVQLTVSDTGVGVPDSIKDKLFEKFVQARDMPLSREKGTGLGLVIVKGIIEAHGGKIWIEDNRPKGTKFVFTLPKN